MENGLDKDPLHRTKLERVHYVLTMTIVDNACRDSDSTGTVSFSAGSAMIVKHNSRVQTGGLGIVASRYRSSSSERFHTKL